MFPYLGASAAYGWQSVCAAEHPHSFDILHEMKHCSYGLTRAMGFPHDECHGRCSDFVMVTFLFPSTCICTFICLCSAKLPDGTEEKRMTAARSHVALSLPEQQHVDSLTTAPAAAQRKTLTRWRKIPRPQSTQCARADQAHSWEPCTHKAR